MNDDDRLREILSQFAGDVSSAPDLRAVRQAGVRKQRMVRWERAMGVVAILACVTGLGIVVLLAWRSGSPVQPADPTPQPSISEIATPSPTELPQPSPSPSQTQQSSVESFEVNPGRGANRGPVGGVGDRIAGLTLDDVKITAAECPRGQACPGRFKFTLTNTTQTAGTWEVRANVYFNGVASLGEGTGIRLKATETGSVVIPFDVSRDPGSDGAGTYTWNWSASRLSTG